MSCAAMRKAKPRLWFGVLAMLVFATVGAATAAEEQSVLEITGASWGPSFNDDAAFGWWQPEKYDLWKAVEEDSSELAELRFLLPGEEYSIFVTAEFYPEISGHGQQYGTEGAVTADHALTAKIDVYDLALAQTFRYRGGDQLRPWLALTHMQISERRSSLQDLDWPRDRADSKLWGAALGLDMDFVLPYELTLSGRFMVRWATGDRDSTFIPTTSYGIPDATQINASDSVDRAMWGAELGIRWGDANTFGVEGGWRHRDWTYDDGPASFSGPYLRLIFRL